MNEFRRLTPFTLPNLGDVVDIRRDEGSFSFWRAKVLSTPGVFATKFDGLHICFDVTNGRYSERFDQKNYWRISE